MGHVEAAIRSVRCQSQVHVHYLHLNPTTTHPIVASSFALERLYNNCLYRPLHQFQLITASTTAKPFIQHLTETTPERLAAAACVLSRLDTIVLELAQTGLLTLYDHID